MKSKRLQGLELVRSIRTYNYVGHVLSWVEKAWRCKEITAADRKSKQKIVKN